MHFLNEKIMENLPKRVPKGIPKSFQYALKQHLKNIKKTSNNNKKTLKKTGLPPRQGVSESAVAAHRHTRSGSCLRFCVEVKSGPYRAVDGDLSQNERN